MILYEEHAWPSLVQSGISACAALSGILIGAWVTSKNQKSDRKISRIREQLKDFYSPMMGMRADVATKSYIRNKVSSVTNAAYQAQFSGITDPQLRAKIESDSWTAFAKTPEYDNDQLRNEIIPVYRKMLDHFTNNLHLAEPSTESFYPQFFEFVEIWNRFLAGSITKEVVEQLDHSEATLTPFYKDLSSNFNRLRTALLE